MTDILIADIGGTTSRFALLGTDGRPDRALSLRDDDFPTFEDAVASYLERSGARPRAAVLGVACPIEGDAIALTNRAWSFRLSEVARRFGFAGVHALNDFEALAWCLPGLRENDLRVLGPRAEGARGTRAVFGPGTGLGVAALVPVGNGWAVVPSEGGHVSFGPVEEDEAPVFARLRAEHGFVSAEAAISGPGLERLHRALHPARAGLSARALVAAATGGDAEARATAALFVRLMGRFAGDLAMTFKAFGGVYVAGGAAQRMGALLDPGIFRAAFENHPPYEHLLRETPTALITAAEPGLLGCARFAQRLRDAGGA